MSALILGAFAMFWVSLRYTMLGIFDLFDIFDTFGGVNSEDSPTLHKGALSANIDITNGCAGTKFTRDMNKSYLEKLNCLPKTKVAKKLRLQNIKKNGTKI